MKHTAQTTGAGIGVPRARLDIALPDSEGEIHHFIAPDNEAGMKKITGRPAGFDVRVINPLLSHKYMQGGIRKNKTDKADACRPAEIAVIEKKLPEPFSSDAGAIRIRQKTGLISPPETQIRTLKAIMNNYGDFREQLKMEGGVAEEAVTEAVRQPDAAKVKPEREIEMMILEKQGQNERPAILTSVPGIPDYAAGLILQFSGENYDKSAKQWIACAGMDVPVKQSGTWHGRGSLSKRGGAYLRRRLFSAAWGATMNSGSFRKYYDELKKKGRKHAEALVIIARRLIRIAFTLLKNNQIFNEQLCFSY